MLKRWERKQSWCNLMWTQSPGMCLEERRNTTKILVKMIGFQLRPQEYEAEVLTTGSLRNSDCTAAPLALVCIMSSSLATGRLSCERSRRKICGTSQLTWGVLADASKTTAFRTPAVSQLSAAASQVQCSSRSQDGIEFCFVAFSSGNAETFFWNEELCTLARNSVLMSSLEVAYYFQIAVSAVSVWSSVLENKWLLQYLC